MFKYLKFWWCIVISKIWPKYMGLAIAITLIVGPLLAVMLVTRNVYTNIFWIFVAATSIASAGWVVESFNRHTKGNGKVEDLQFQQDRVNTVAKVAYAWAIKLDDREMGQAVTDILYKLRMDGWIDPDKLDMAVTDIKTAMGNSRVPETATEVWMYPEEYAQTIDAHISGNSSTNRTRKFQISGWVQKGEPHNPTVIHAPEGSLHDLSPTRDGWVGSPINPYKGWGAGDPGPGNTGLNSRRLRADAGK